MKKILIGLLVIVVLLVIAGFFLPGQIEISKSININAPASAAFEEVNTLKNWEHWSYWSNLFKDKMTVTYGEQGSGTGAWYSWDGEESGKGKLTITESVPPTSIKTDLDFMEQGTAKNWYTFEPAGDSTKITIGFSSELGMNPFMRWIGVLMIKPEMQKAFDYNLTRLKEVAEAKPKFTVTITEETWTPVNYISLSTTMSPKDAGAISAQMGKMYGELMGVLKKANVEMTGPPFSLYPHYSEESMEMVCALPVPANAKLPARYKVQQTLGGKAVKGIHRGDYAKLKDTHDQILSYLQAKSLEITGAPAEVYITDPGVEKDTTAWVTEIYYPVN